MRSPCSPSRTGYGAARARPYWLRAGVRCISLALATAVVGIGFAAPTASADICGVVGLVNGVAGKTCTVVSHGAKLLKAGKKLVTGHVGGAVRTVLSSGGGRGSSSASTAIGLTGIVAWVSGGAEVALHETSKVLGDTTSPQLTSTWFSAEYWRMAAIGAVLTMPFLFAAAVQALVRSDLTLLTRAALGYLPLAMLAISIAAPLTMLLLAGSDQMSAIIGGAAGDGGARFLDHAAGAIGALTLLSGSPFLAFLVGLFTAVGALVLWVELLMREAAVYVIVLMLPLVFAAFVWPPRRVWAMRAIELLVALILSKFAIVAVLGLGGAALSRSTDSLTGSLGGVVLLLMGAFAPWALLRLIPLAELASAAVGSLRAEGRTIGAAASAADAGGRGAHLRWGEDWATGVIAGMRRQAAETPSPGERRDDQHRPEEERVAELAEVSAAAGRASPADRLSPAADGPSPAADEHSPAADGPSAGSDGARPAATANDGVPTSADAPADPDAGIGPLLEAPNGGWRELYLGPDDGRPPAPLWPPERSDAAAPRAGGGAGSRRGGESGGESGPHRPEALGSERGGTVDDHDPRPPTQEPGRGRLSPPGG